jgi:hypothetical protein
VAMWGWGSRSTAAPQGLPLLHGSQDPRQVQQLIQGAPPPPHSAHAGLPDSDLEKGNEEAGQVNTIRNQRSSKELLDLRKSVSPGVWVSPKHSPGRCQQKALKPLCSQPRPWMQTQGQGREEVERCKK